MSSLESKDRLGFEHRYIKTTNCSQITMNTKYALLIDILGSMQIAAKNYTPLLEAGKAKRLVTHSSTQRVSQAWSSCPLLVWTGLIPSQSGFITMAWVTILRVECYSMNVRVKMENTKHQSQHVLPFGFNSKVLSLSSVIFIFLLIDFLLCFFKLKLTKNRRGRSFGAPLSKKEQHPSYSWRDGEILSKSSQQIAEPNSSFTNSSCG